MFLRIPSVDVWGIPGRGFSCSRKTHHSVDVRGIPGWCLFVSQKTNPFCMLLWFVFVVGTNLVYFKRLPTWVHLLYPSGV